jgi:type IV pilus assembly protein PilW
MNRSCVRQRHQGFSLIDVMVGIVIALVAMLVVYQVFAVGEQFKRNTTSIGEAQVNGLLASFVLGQQLANSGSALAAAAMDLASCEDQAAEPNLTKRFAKSWRPIPVLIFDSGASNTPDSFLVNYSTSTNIIAPALAITSSVGKYVVQSPNGFHPLPNTTERKDLIVAIEKSPNAAIPGKCEPARVDSVVPSVTAACLAAQGCVELSYTGTALATTPYSVFNMGAADDAQKISYDIVEEVTNNPCASATPPFTPCVLRSTQLLDNTGALSAAAPNPLASNIVNMKVQYGIDTNGDGMFDTWVTATGAWAPAVLLAAATPIATLNQIKVIRMGIIVRGEQFERGLGDYKWTMFGGTVTGTIAATLAPAGNWRYRVYESVIPLRNEIWNKLS